MPTELEIWNTFWLATLANAAYFVGLAFFNISAHTDILIAQFFTWLTVSSSLTISSMPWAFDSMLQLGGIVNPRFAAKL